MDKLNSDIAATYDRENRGVPRLFAKYITTLVPPITNASVIHDNACGPAVVTSEILNSNAHPLRISATDISPPMIAAAEKVIKTNHWDVATAAVMDSKELSFEKDTFSHSFTNFLVPNQPDAVLEIYRTLKPGGTSAFTVWKFHGFLDLMRRCTKVIVPNAEASGPPAATEDALRAQFEKVGFGREDIQIKSRCEYLRFSSIDDLVTLTEGPFGKFFTKDWKEEEVGRLPEVIGQVLTAAEVERQSLEMVAWVVIALKS